MRTGSLVCTKEDYRILEGVREYESGAIVHLVNPPTPDGIYTVKSLTKQWGKPALRLEECTAYLDGEETPFNPKHFIEIQSPDELDIEALIEESISVLV